MFKSHQKSKTYVMARGAAARRAMTLFEIIAVVAIIGTVSLMATTRYSAATISDVGAQGFARRVALDCSQARRRAIATGDNHLLRFTLTGGNATQYGVYRKVSGVPTLVDDIHAVPANVTVMTGGVTDLEFQYTGEALASYTVTVTSANRTRTVTVPQVTGKAFVD
jgi:prepilin-type N-terminal cleavage/methylation domain-containing protein